MRPHLIPHFIEAFQISYDGHELRVDKELDREKIKRLQCALDII